MRPTLAILLAVLLALPASAAAPHRGPDRVATPEEALRAFRQMAVQQDIAFCYPIDGCYSRAHLMARRLHKLGYRPGKVWAFANGEWLHARTLNDPRGYVEWGWHVAPTLRVRTTDGVQDMVLDPSLCSRPVTLDEWKRTMMSSPTSREPFLCLTRLGEPPCRPRGGRSPGTGYWNGGDPTGDLDAHAHGVMRRYQGLVDGR
jgi:hypothetical protein